MATCQLVCLVLVFCVMMIRAQFYPDHRSQKKIMDEGFEFFRESPSFWLNSLSTYSPRGYLNSRRGLANVPANNYYELPMSTNEPSPYSEAPHNVGDAPAGGYNSNSGGGSIFQSRGFIDEGLEHVREFGTFGNWQSLMNNPSLLLGSMFL